MDYLQRDDEFFGDFLDTDGCVDDEFVFDEGVDFFSFHLRNNQA